MHRLPAWGRPSDKRAEDRIHTQVLPEQLSRAFLTARTEAGITGDNEVTFHEIRSLGGALLHNQQGWSKQDVQNLLTHSSAAMTDAYFDGHDVLWTQLYKSIFRHSISLEARPSCLMRAADIREMRPRTRRLQLLRIYGTLKVQFRSTKRLRSSEVHRRQRTHALCRFGCMTRTLALDLYH